MPSVDLPSKCEESLFYTFIDFRWGLHELDTEFISQFSSLFFGNSTLLGPVWFVSDENLIDTFRGMLLNVGMPCADILWLALMSTS